MDRGAGTASNFSAHVWEGVVQKDEAVGFGVTY
jgi:hypothetical protein